ncbi:MAG: DUF4445 domain-containing protein [Firmicutes bacterium]|nr:DUF4445 domain-containing protein [Bacillota bacterium]
MACFQVTFTNLGLRVSVEEGVSLLTAAWMAGINMRSDCKGHGVCGKCKVIISELVTTPHGQYNHRFFSQMEILQGWRLACEVMVHSDLDVIVPKISRDMGALVRKTYTDRIAELKPFIKRFYFEIPPFESNHGTGMWERCSLELASKYGLTGIRIASTAMIRLSNLAGRTPPPLEAFVDRHRQVICIRRRRERPMLGLAVDIGTTSIAVYLGDLDHNCILAADSVLNPQIVYGDDVLSRISLIEEKPEMLNTLQNDVIQVVNSMISHMTNIIGSSPDDIMDITVVGNTTMHHLFLGLNPVALGKYPFVPTVKTAQYVPAALLGLNVNPGAQVYMFPVFSAYVGADTIGVRIAEPDEEEKKKLIIDIGTNGELIINNNNKSFCTSCATGPAFEGAQISFGMRAAPGAIEKVSITSDSWDVICETIPPPGLTKGDAPKAIGICGSGIISAIAEMLKAKIIRADGSFYKNKKHPRLRKESKSEKYEFILCYSGDCDLDEDLTICQNDIRAIQLGKAALLASAQIMLDHAGLKEPDEIILAGAFGSYLDIDDALTIGMLPQCPRNKIRAVGNAAGDGARLALFNWDFREQAQETEKHTEFIALSKLPGFQDAFIRAVNFPSPYN